MNNIFIKNNRVNIITLVPFALMHLWFLFLSLHLKEEKRNKSKIVIGTPSLFFYIIGFGELRTEFLMLQPHPT